MTPPTAPDPKKMAIPICPHCTKDLPTMAMFNWQMGPAIILCLFCPECKKPLHFETASMPDQQRSPLIS